jgi:hypothetical protein
MVVIMLIADGFGTVEKVRDGEGVAWGVESLVVDVGEIEALLETDGECVEMEEADLEVAVPGASLAVENAASEAIAELRIEVESEFEDVAPMDEALELKLAA